MKSDREKDIAPVPVRAFDGKAVEAEVVDAASVPQLWTEPRPVQAPVTTWTAKGTLKAARLNTDIIGEDKRAAELELRITQAEAEAVKLRAETFALLKQVAVRVQHMRREMEELVTQIEIEVKTRRDRVLTAKANAARERVLATLQYRIARYDAFVARHEAKMRADSALQNYRNNRTRTSETGQVDAAKQRNLVAWAELAVVEAAEGNLDNAPVSPYGEFAAYHYVCARLRGETHGDAIASTARTLINRKLVKPMEENDEQRAFYRGRYNKLHVTWRDHRQAVRTAEERAFMDQAAKERDALQKEIADLKLKTVERELEIAKLHHGAADAGGDTVYDREN